MFAQLKASATSRAYIAKDGEVKVNNDGTEIKVAMQKLISQYQNGDLTKMIEAVKSYNPIKVQQGNALPATAANTNNALPAGSSTGTLELPSNQ